MGDKIIYVISSHNTFNSSPALSQFRLSQRIKKASTFVEAFAFVRARVGIRTPNLLIRSQMLYPIELRMHYSPRLQGLGTTLERGANIINI